jgi:hypothetical protein
MAITHARRWRRHGVALVGWIKPSRRRIAASCYSERVSLHPNIAQAFEILRFQSSLRGQPDPDMEQVYRRVLAVFGRVGAKWTLVGAHAVNAYVRPRATIDVDFVVEAPKLKKVLAELEKEFGALATTDIGAAVRVINLSIDLIRSDNHSLFRAALDKAEDRGGARVPPPELLVALEFLAARSPWRKLAEKKQDAADLINVYQASADEFNRDAALQYAASVYPGAERELQQMLDRVDAGEDIGI